MQVRNLVMTTCPFEEYLALPGWSHSGLKNEDLEWKPPTKKMELGVKVHNYLLKPEEYNYEDIDTVKPLALSIKNRIGPLFDLLRKEVAITADFIYSGFVMQYKGRFDLGLEGLIVIDPKISDIPLSRSIAYFNYDRPMSGYAIAIGAPSALLASVNPKTKKTELMQIPISQVWWHEQILKKGEPL